MKALQITGPGAAGLIELATPEPGEQEVLVRVDAVTTCAQWDLHLMSGRSMFPGRDLVYPYQIGQPGHEATGTVMRIGESVTALAIGDRVCAWRDGGHHRLGCYAEYVCRPETDFLRVPPDLPPKKVAPLELAMTVRVSFAALERIDAVAGARFGVSGLGAAGVVAIQMARAGGAREVVGYDLSQERRDLAVRVGADGAFDPREQPPVDRHSADALDTSIECAGSAASAQFLMDRTRRAVALFGVLRDEVTFGWSHWTGLTLVGYPFGEDGRPAHTRSAAEAALDLVARRAIDLSVLVGETLPLADYARGIEILREQRALKICFVP